MSMAVLYLGTPDCLKTPFLCMVDLLARFKTKMANLPFLTRAFNPLKKLGKMLPATLILVVNVLQNTIVDGMPRATPTPPSATSLSVTLSTVIGAAGICCWFWSYFDNVRLNYTWLNEYLHLHLDSRRYGVDGGRLGWSFTPFFPPSLLASS